MKRLCTHGIILSQKPYFSLPIEQRKYISSLTLFELSPYKEQDSSEESSKNYFFSKRNMIGADLSPRMCYRVSISGVTYPYLRLHTQKVQKIKLTNTSADENGYNLRYRHELHSVVLKNEIITASKDKFFPNAMLTSTNGTKIVLYTIKVFMG